MKNDFVCERDDQRGHGAKELMPRDGAPVLVAEDTADISLAEASILAFCPKVIDESICYEDGLVPDLFSKPSKWSAPGEERGLARDVTFRWSLRQASRCPAQRM